MRVPSASRDGIETGRAGTRVGVAPGVCASVAAVRRVRTDLASSAFPCLCSIDRAGGIDGGRCEAIDGALDHVTSDWGAASVWHWLLMLAIGPLNALELLLQARRRACVWTMMRSSLSLS